MTNFYNLPKDPVMLLSFVNTQLRDNFSSLEDFVTAYQTDTTTIINCLQAIDYSYDPAQNQFI